MRKPATLNRSRKKESSKAKSTEEEEDPLYKYKNTPDECHNGGTPACILLEDAMLEIFPELIPVKQQETDYRKLQQGEIPEFPSHRDQSQGSRKPQDTSEDSLRQPLPKPTALGELLRWRFLRLAMQQTRDKKDGDKNIGCEENGEAASKKKKKRKKKKKAGDDVDVDTAGGEMSSPETTTLSPAVEPLSREIVNGRKKGDRYKDSKNGNNVVPVGQASGGTEAVQMEEQSAGSNQASSNEADPNSDFVDASEEERLPLVLRLHRRTEEQVDAQGDVPEQSKADAHRQSVFQWIAQEIPHDDTNKTDKEWMSFVEFCKQKTTPNGKGMFQIPLKDVVEIARKIQCQNCRLETLDIIHQLAHNADQSLTSSAVVTMNPRYLNPPVPSLLDEGDLAASLGYHLMEEGNLPSMEDDEMSMTNDEGASAPYISLVLVAKEKRKVGTMMDNISAYFLHTQNLDVEHLDNFLPSWLFCGISESLLTYYELVRNEVGKTSSSLLPDATLISKKRMSIIKREVIGSLEQYCELLDSEMRENLTEEINDVSRKLASSDTFHFTASSILESCDDMCAKYITEEILEILLYVEEKIISGGELSVELNIWRAFFEGLWSVSECCEEYYSTMEEELVDQNGVIENKLTSPRARQLCADFVEKKVAIMTNVDCFIKATKNRTMMKERLTEGLWLHSEVNRKRNDDYIDLAEECKEIIRSLVDWTKELRGRRMKELRRMQREKRERLRDQIEGALPTIFRLQEEVESYFTEDEKKDLDLYRESARKVKGGMSLKPSEENEKIFEAGASAILLWRACRIGEHRRQQSLAPALPRPLQEWATEKKSGLDLCPSDDHLAPCWPGKGCKRRVRCILAGILYRWLSDMCTEWRSETAAMELLSDFDSELLPSPQTGEGSAKSSRKGKKKKKKVLVQSNPELESTGSNYQQPNTKGSPEAENIRKDAIDNVPKHKEQERAREPDKDIEFDPSKAAEPHLEPKLNQFLDKFSSESESVLSEFSGEHARIDLNGMEKPETENHAAQRNEIDFDLYESAVMIENDEGKLISAADYLIGRFDAVMDKVLAGG
ncbi:hypothetical protein IV203_029075 [Nitzschia inconspicua]|uniref:Uncharacterized protein n=1 Tax=Nitzschia inconspicua TaxID=303405 RepID=A0A9K3LQT7_9STRA|nr:hypothetical protein IV203_029075 [Nitzschia inconspicua]